MSKVSSKVSSDSKVGIAKLVEAVSSVNEALSHVTVTIREGVLQEDKDKLMRMIKQASDGISALKVAEPLTSPPPPPPPLPLAKAACAGTGADSPSNNAHENNDVVKAVTKIVRRATAAFTTVPGGSINVTSQAVDDVVTFRPLSTIGRNWLAAHPTLVYGIYCIWSI